MAGKRDRMTVAEKTEWYKRMFGKTQKWNVKTGGLDDWAIEASGNWLDMENGKGYRAGRIQPGTSEFLMFLRFKDDVSEGEWDLPGKGAHWMLFSVVNNFHSGILARANAKVIFEMFKDEIEVEAASPDKQVYRMNTTYNWPDDKIDSLMVRIFDDNGCTTAAARKLYEEVIARMEDYPVLDETVWGEMEQEALDRELNDPESTVSERVRDAVCNVPFTRNMGSYRLAFTDDAKITASALIDIFWKGLPNPDRHLPKMKKHAIRPFDFHAAVMQHCEMEDDGCCVFPADFSLDMPEREIIGRLPELVEIGLTPVPMEG